MEWAGIAVLGGLGAVLRFELSVAVKRRHRGEFPFGILVVNLLGSFVLGFLTGADIGGTTMSLLGVGLLGAFTTFSTWMVDTRTLRDGGRPALAILNIVGSLVLGIAAAAIGWAVGAAIL